MLEEKVTQRYRTVKEAFVRWDTDCDGEISDREFRAAREYCAGQQGYLMLACRGERSGPQQNTNSLRSILVVGDVQSGVWV